MLDPCESEIDQVQIPTENWATAPCGPCKEHTPCDSLVPRRTGFAARDFVDSSHSRDSFTRLSRTRIVVLLRNGPAFSFSKKQGACEESSFGSEFAAIKSCCEHLPGLLCKTQVLGTSVELPSCALGGNQSVLPSSSKPHSILKKKSSSTSYHFSREVVAKSEWRATHLNAHLSPSGTCA